MLNYCSHQAEDVYAQVVYSVVHSIGRSTAASAASTGDEILDYARRVFQFGNDRHQDIVDSVRQINVSSFLGQHIQDYIRLFIYVLYINSHLK